jgi:hypothetical protein
VKFPSAFLNAGLLLEDVVLRLSGEGPLRPIQLLLLLRAQRALLGLELVDGLLGRADFLKRGNGEGGGGSLRWLAVAGCGWQSILFQVMPSPQGHHFSKLCTVHMRGPTIHRALGSSLCCCRCSLECILNWRNE